MATQGREDQIGVRSVTREVGVAPQSLYLHFSGVDELLWEVYCREYGELA
jgi:AcrR family transcriptional regulator